MEQPDSAKTRMLLKLVPKDVLEVAMFHSI